MKLSDFSDFIRSFPTHHQSFDIKRANWKVVNQRKIVDSVFGDNEVITLNRYDLINSSWNIEDFIVKTLMWGYPTKGRGKNIDSILSDKNFAMLSAILRDYQDTDISIQQLKYDLSKIQGLGLSTMSKFAYFLDTSIDSNKALILDRRIINSLNKNRFTDLSHLSYIPINNAINYYSEYLQTICQLAQSISVEPAQIELFLFTFGNNISELKGENCYDYD